MNSILILLLALFSSFEPLYAENKANLQVISSEKYWLDQMNDICAYQSKLYTRSEKSLKEIPDSVILNLGSRLHKSDLYINLCILNTLWHFDRPLAKKLIRSEELRRKQKNASSNVSYKELQIKNSRFPHSDNTLGRCLGFNEKFVARTQNDIEPFLKKMKPCGKLEFPEVDFSREMVLFQAGGGNNAKHEKKLFLSMDRKHLLFEVLPIVEMQFASSSDVRYYAVSIAQLPTDVKVEFKVHKGNVNLVSSEKIFEDCKIGNCTNR